MITIEQIDEFRKRTNSSYADAKYFLEKNNGDVLEAIIDFERSKTGRSSHNHGHYNGYNYNYNYNYKYNYNYDYKRDCCSGNNQEYGRKFADLLQKGFDTRIFVEDRNSVLFSIPVILLLLLLPLWVIVMIMFIFFAMLGYRISIRDVKSRNVNINDFFHNISQKMKESNPGSKQADPQKPGRPPVPVDINAPEVQNSDAEPEAKKDEHKEDGFKEYTIE